MASTGGKIGQKNLDPSAMGNGESKRGDMIVADAGFPETIGERVLISAQAHGKGQRSSPRGPSVAQPLGHTVSHFLSSVLSLPRHVPDDE